MRLTREEAWELLSEYNKSDALIKHALTVEGVMRHFAKLNGEEWTAMSKDETRIEAGKLVEVVAIEGVKLIVKEVSEELLEGEPIKENKDSISKEIDIKIKTSK